MNITLLVTPSVYPARDRFTAFALYPVLWHEKRPRRLLPRFLRLSPLAQSLSRCPIPFFPSVSQSVVVEKSVVRCIDDIAQTDFWRGREREGGRERTRPFRGPSEKDVRPPNDSRTDGQSPMNFNLGHSVARPLLVLLHLISAVVVARNHDDVRPSVR